MCISPGPSSRPMSEVRWTTHQGTPLLGPCPQYCRFRRCLSPHSCLQKVTETRIIQTELINESLSRSKLGIDEMLLFETAVHVTKLTTATIAFRVMQPLKKRHLSPCRVPVGCDIAKIIAWQIEIFVFWKNKQTNKQTYKKKIDRCSCLQAFKLVKHFQEGITNDWIY